MNDFGRYTVKVIGVTLVNAVVTYAVGVLTQKVVASKFDLLIFLHLKKQPKKFGF